MKTYKKICNMVDLIGNKNFYEPASQRMDLKQIAEVVNAQLIKLAVSLTAAGRAKYNAKNYTKVVELIQKSDEDIKLRKDQADLLNKIAKKWNVNKNNLL
jgi:hypothetical protein